MRQPDDQLLAAGKILFEKLNEAGLVTGAWCLDKWEDLPEDVQHEFANAVDAALVALPYE